ncbi:MAG: arginine--tRNA ligase [Armatimonadaceae bacterium]
MSDYSLPTVYVYDRVREEATRLIVTTGIVSADAVTLVTPKPNIPADVAFPVFPLAGPTGMKPNELAEKLASEIVLPEGSLIGSVEAAGGFVNFAVRPEVFAAEVVREVQGRAETFGQDSSVGDGQKVVLEYSSPNIARKMHVGHLRTTVIGHALHKIMRALGYEVIADNHLGDWGTQFGTLLAALDLWGLTPWNDPDPVQSLVHIYADYNNAVALEQALLKVPKPDGDNSPERKLWETGDSLITSLKRGSGDSLYDLARIWFRKLEDGDKWARETWQKLIDITMTEFDRTYERLGIRFDTVHGESYYEPMMAPLVQEAIEKGVARLEESGAVSVDFGDQLPSCLLRKTDGATLYQTRDAATCIFRWANYQPVRNIYVVGAEQKLHFQQVFEIVRRMGYTEIADRSVHIPFGQVTGASGERFSMRRGNVIFLDEILDAAVERAEGTIREKIAEGKTELTEDQIDAVSEMVGVGSVIYADLYQGPERNIKFDFEKIVAFEGNTALYIQYTHARCCSILREAGDAASEIAGANPGLLVDAPEMAVLKHLHRLPHVVREAGEKFSPSTVAEWVYNLCREFARFYENCPVLKADTPERRAARLALVAASAQGMKNGMALLGIGVPDRM